MKVVVTTTGNTLDSGLDQRFGRAEKFMVIDLDTLQFETIDNDAVSAAGGAGIVAAQAVVETGAQTLITGYVGPNALTVLKTAQITIYKGQVGTIQENIDQLKKNALEKLEEAVPAHFGMGQAK